MSDALDEVHILVSDMEKIKSMPTDGADMVLASTLPLADPSGKLVTAGYLSDRLVKNMVARIAELEAEVKKLRERPEYHFDMKRISDILDGKD